MAYKHKKWVPVHKVELARLDQSTVNAIRWHGTSVDEHLAKRLGVTVQVVQYIRANPAFMRHIED